MAGQSGGSPYSLQRPDTKNPLEWLKGKSRALHRSEMILHCRLPASLLDARYL